MHNVHLVHVQCTTRVTYMQLMPRACARWYMYMSVLYSTCVVGAVSMNKACDLAKGRYRETYYFLLSWKIEVK